MASDQNTYNTNYEMTKIKRIVDPNVYYPIGDGDHGQIKPSMYVDDGIPYIRVQNLSWGFNIDFENMVFLDKDVHNANKKSILREGDILIAKTGATIGKTAIIPKGVEANTTSSVAKITVDKDRYSQKFVGYAVRSHLFTSQIWQTANQKSAQPGFNINDLVEYLIPNPTLGTQYKIANFLDKKVYKINELIQVQEDSIAKLEEYKQSVITEAVTKGLRPNVKMRFSGLDHLGYIPIEWDVVPIKRHYKIINGSTPKSENQDFWDGDINWITPADFKSEMYITESKRKITKDGYKSCNTTLVDVGTVVITGRAPIGNVNIAGTSLCFNQGCKALVGNDDDNRFLFYFLSTKTDALTSIGQGTTFLELSTGSLGDFKITYPEKKIQKEISDFLDKKTDEIGQLIHVKKDKIEKLNEYKKSLIYEAVTGKIEVM